MSEVSEEEMKAVMEQLKGQIDPRKLMTPTQREIAELTKEEAKQTVLLDRWLAIWRARWRALNYKKTPSLSARGSSLSICQI